MGIVVYRKTKPRIGGPLPPLVLFDAGLSEEHSIENEITDEPVEDGYRTDGVITRPRVVRITGIVSSGHPLPRLGRSGDPITGITRGSNKLHIRAWRQLVQLFELRELVDIVTPIEAYENMVGQSARAPRAKTDGTSFRFSLVFRSVEVARIDDVSDFSPELAELGGDVDDLGAQGLSPASGVG